MREKKSPSGKWESGLGCHGTSRSTGPGVIIITDISHVRSCGTGGRLCRVTKFWIKLGDVGCSASSSKIWVNYSSHTWIHKNKKGITPVRDISVEDGRHNYPVSLFIYGKIYGHRVMADDLVWGREATCSPYSRRPELDNGVFLVVKVMVEHPDKFKNIRNRWEHCGKESESLGRWTKRVQNMHIGL